MTHLTPITPAAPTDTTEPNPRPGLRWTPAKMAEFLRLLSATHSVSAAARSVGMSRQSAYRLRSRLKGLAFDLAWDVAFHHSYDNLAHAALERALNGVEIPVFHGGEQVGSYRRFDERLTIALLQWATPRGVPVIGRHALEAERHAGRFEALVAEVAAAGDRGPAEDEGPAPPSELSRFQSIELSPVSDAAVIEHLRGSARKRAR